MVNLTKSIQAISLTALFAAGILSFSYAPTVQAVADMVTICHGAGQDDTTQFVTLTLARNAVYQDQGNGGHFYENGTPKAGHEQDYLGECITPSASPSVSPSASPSVSPSVSPSASPSVSPSASPSVSPSATPTPTPTPTPGNNDNHSDNNSDSGSSNNSSSEGEVLGAYAETGVAEDVIMNALGSLGGLMTAAGSVLYDKKRSKI